MPTRARTAPAATKPAVRLRPGLSRLLGLVVVASVGCLMLAACGSPSSGAPAKTASPSTSALESGRTVHLGGGPQASVLDPATDTLYVASENGSGPGTVAVIDASTCNALQASGCRSAPLVTKVGIWPDVVAVNQATDTIYVGNRNTLSVINGAVCNARDTSGCKSSWPTVKVGLIPAAIAVDQATDAIYVATWANGKARTLSVIDGATCNGRVSSGCSKDPGHITIGRSPDGVVFDPATSTVYAATVAPDLSQAVWLVNGATCNPATMSGCTAKAVPVRTGKGSTGFDVALAVDQASRTLYLANWQDNTVSMIDTARCNAANSSGCGRTPGLADIGNGPDSIAVDTATDTVYATTEGADEVAVLNSDTCNATASADCQTRILSTGSTPQWVTVDQATDTVYVPNGDSADVSIFDGATCDATADSGCA
jgi:DNA-binding beta-propeller fold protein YncE